MEVKFNAVELTVPLTAAVEQVLTPAAQDFIAALHREFNPTRERLLEQRGQRQARLNAGERPTFLAETESIRTGQWQVAPAPDDLNNRRVEITGPVERKMMINALNSGAKVFMADFEDSLSPTWENVIGGQINCMEAVRRTIELTQPDGKQYRLNDEIATLVVRPRGWHLVEKHVLVDGEPISASLFDFGLYFFHNAKELLHRRSGPYFYLPKMESHLEARLWNEVFNFAQDYIGIQRGLIRATVLIETILAAFEMEEILYELRDHAAGLNAGRWDYIFSSIKKFSQQADFVLPDRAQITMTVPFMRFYTELLVKTCHQRGAHAIGGMAAFIPSRKDAAVNDIALAKVREDKEREAGDGFDGTWVAHPDLVPVALEVFDRVLGHQPHQKNRQRTEVNVLPPDLYTLRVPNGTITEAGVRNNISVALQYLNAWFNGNGAVAIFNLMEDAATAEISRSQLWQWIRCGATLETGELIDEALYTRLVEEELAKLPGDFTIARQTLDELVLAPEFVEFLTLKAYDRFQ